jgi:uncharacterized protein (DUF58 family)
MRALFLPDRFFWLFGAVAALFALSYGFAFLLPIAQMTFGLGVTLVAVDAALLYRKGHYLQAVRHTASVWSLGDENTVTLSLHNAGPLRLFVEVVDELPIPLQARRFALKTTLVPAERKKITYTVRPVERGVYAFGKVHLFARTPLGLLERRFTCAQDKEVAVYPSILQMRRYERITADRLFSSEGTRNDRRLSHSYEFDQIKPYVEGDDYRDINWKATGRRGALMVNQYQEERSQQVFCLIDKSRAMNMPFDGLSLLDYAINAALALSNVALKKQDRLGILSFSDVLGTTLPAERGTRQLHRILEALYREQARTTEANYELLYEAVRRLIPARSLLILFTNFESPYALERVLPHLRRLGRLHLLVVVFFENTEVRALAESKPKNLLQHFQKTVAAQWLEEKKDIGRHLNRYGIQALLTPPQSLSLNTLNKYLELKARGLI